MITLLWLKSCLVLGITILAYLRVRTAQRLCCVGVPICAMTLICPRTLVVDLCCWVIFWLSHNRWTLA